MRAALKKQWGHMRPVGRQFDMPDLDYEKVIKTLSKLTWVASRKRLGNAVKNHFKI